MTDQARSAAMDRCVTEGEALDGLVLLAAHVAVEAVREIAEDLSLGRREFVAVRDSAFRKVAGKDTFDHDPMMP